MSISGHTLIRTSGANRSEQHLPTDDAVLAAYRDHFGITLDRVPRAAGTRAGGLVNQAGSQRPIP